MFRASYIIIWNNNRHIFFLKQQVSFIEDVAMGLGTRPIFLAWWTFVLLIDFKNKCSNRLSANTYKMLLRDAECLWRRSLNTTRLTYQKLHMDGRLKITRRRRRTFVWFALLQTKLFGWGERSPAQFEYKVSTAKCNLYG